MDRLKAASYEAIDAVSKLLLRAVEEDREIKWTSVQHGDSNVYEFELVLGAPGSHNPQPSEREEFLVADTLGTTNSSLVFTNPKLGKIAPPVSQMPGSSCVS